MEALTVVDICRRAGIDAVTVSVTGHKQVMGSHNIAVHADEVYDNIEFEKMDAIVLPGGLPGAVNLHEHEGVNIQVKELFETGRLIGAICAAPGAVLAPAGVLKGRRATVYPGLKQGKILNGPERQSCAAETSLPEKVREPPCCSPLKSWIIWRGKKKLRKSASLL